MKSDAIIKCAAIGTLNGFALFLHMKIVSGSNVKLPLYFGITSVLGVVFVVLTAAKFLEWIFSRRVKMPPPD